MPHERQAFFPFTAVPKLQPFGQEPDTPISASAAKLPTKRGRSRQKGTRTLSS